MVFDKVAISKSIDKIIKSFGGAPTHTTTDLDDCIEDLANNLPFSTKTEMIDIVPKQIVETFSQDGSIFYAPIGEYALELGKTYNVKFNGIVFELECYDDSTNTTLGAKPYGNYTDYPFSIVNWGSTMNLCKLSNEPAIISIYEEQETVKPLDVKFLPIEELKQALGLA